MKLTAEQRQAILGFMSRNEEEGFAYIEAIIMGHIREARYDESQEHRKIRERSRVMDAVRRYL